MESPELEKQLNTDQKWLVRTCYLDGESFPPSFCFPSPIHYVQSTFP